MTLSFLGSPGGAFACPPELVTLVGQRVALSAFSTSQPPQLTLLASSTALALPLTGSPASSGTFEVSGDTLRYNIPDELMAAESVFRLAWQILTARAGGVLIHSSGVVHNGRALVAAGISTAGKSTLSSLAVDAGCIPLSDEIIQVFPDGTVRGTPFRSNALFDGTPTVAPLAYAVSLHKGDREELRDVPVQDVVNTFLSQVFTQPGLEMPKGHAARVVLSALSNARVAQLSFRKHPDAGQFVKALLS